MTDLEKEVIRLKRRISTLEQEQLRLERQNQDIRTFLENSHILPRSAQNNSDQASWV